MVFSSLVFIFRFLPICFIIYYLIPAKFKNLCLVFGSLIFYSFGEVKYFFLMILSIIIDFCIGFLIGKFKEFQKIKIFLLICSITFNLGLLITFKYFNFFIANLNVIFNNSFNILNLSLPLGISFYTFQTMSYTIDVFRNKVSPEKNIIDFAAFVSLFPQLIAGPIVKYTDIDKEIKNRTLNKDIIENGIELFIIGFGQKVILANNLGVLWNEILQMDFSLVPTPLAWLGIISFSLQIYFDFNGYSLMAIGLGKMLGFTFPRNFNYPYISRSITEFWRRWHITLGNWFKEYLYIPLGGSRKGILKLIRNLAIVWLCTGLWHGAEINFIIWGVYFFILIIIEKKFLCTILEKNKFFSHIYTLVLILIGWIIFSFTNLNDIYLYIHRLVIFKGGNCNYYIRNYFLILSIGIIFSTPLIKKIYIKIFKNEIIKTILLIVIFFISIAYLIDSSYNPFLYFRF